MIRFSTALLLLVALAIPAQAANDRRILLFTSFANAKEKERHPKPKRQRFIEPDLAALDAPGLKKNELQKVAKKLTAALFDDTVVHIELESVERNGADAIVWHGRIEGDETSNVDIVVKDNSLVATISTLSKRYMIEPGENGTHEALELDLASFPNELEPIRPIQSNASRPDTVVANDSAAFIDVLVVYTDDLRASLGNTASAVAAATSAIAATNTAYANSGVTPRVRLAGTLEVAYNDSGNLETALYDLRGTSDGQMDNVHTVRNQVGADAVALLTLNGSGGTCGIGFLMGSLSAGFASNAFSATRWSCAVGNLSFPHELGHNFGLEHDRFVSPSGTPAYPYGFGYVDSQLQFRDIMAYANACGCTRIQYFSNPNMTYLSRPLGIHYESSPGTSADNVRALNNAAMTIANWRQAVSGYTPATFTDNPLVAASTRVKAIHITELRTAINNYRASVSLPAATWSPIAMGTVITAAHITEMRTALTAALPAAVYTNPLPGTIRAVHIQELRNYLD
jgi:peptidyl-Asp metalloendopeptidase